MIIKDRKSKKILKDVEFRKLPRRTRMLLLKGEHPDMILIGAEATAKAAKKVVTAEDMQPMVEKPKVEEAKAEEPKAEEPKAEVESEETEEAEETEAEAETAPKKKKKRKAKKAEEAD